MKPNRLLSQSLIGAVDQALLSAFNLCVGVAFIMFAPKSEYVAFVLATSAVLPAHSAQNAMAGSPLATLVPAAADVGQRRAVMEARRHVHFWTMLALDKVLGPFMPAHRTRPT